MPEDDSALSLTDRYEILTLLGQGGTSLVYKAKDKSLDRFVAIKTLTVKSLSEQQYVTFQQEARALSNLKHPSIMEILDFGMTKSGKPYMVLEYIEGVSLAKHIESLGPLPIEIALPVFSNLCEGLSHAHSKNILHRDIKPSNIILINEGNNYHPKIIDFGLAVLDIGEGHTNQPDNFAGSPPYMSPEQIANQELDKRSDIYSLGCTLYEALVGVVPYSGASAFETMNMHISSPIPALPPLIENEVLQAHLQGIVSRLLAKERDLRIQSVPAVKGELDDLNARIKDTAKAKKQSEAEEALAFTAAQPTIKFEEKPKSYFKFLAISSVVLSLILLIVVYVYETQHARFQENDISNEDESTTTVQNINKVQTRQKAIETYVAQSPGKNTTQKLAQDISGNSDLIAVRNNTENRAKAPNLKTLPKNEFDFDLSVTDLSKSNLTDLAAYPKLRNLNVSNCNLGPEQIKQITAIKNLEKLNIRINPKIAGADFSQLKALKKLISLSVEACALQPKAVIQLSELKGLQELNLEHNYPLTVEAVDHLAKMPKLKKLFLSNSVPDKEVIRRLGKIKNLESLYIEKTNLKDDDFAYLLEQLPNLKKISANFTDITLKSIKLAVRAPKLKILLCSGCKELGNEVNMEAIETYNKTQSKVKIINQPFSDEVVD
ncbi:protein kinase [bacterium]|nr:protein kinase [bacterium]QQR58353.1 MAG: protein kinase [Candidatus Melainabacteria bacterium]